MPAINNSKHYGYISIYLHWVIAVLVIFMLTLGIVMGDIPPDYKGWWYNLHKSTGILILALATVRLIWRLINTKPAAA